MIHNILEEVTIVSKYHINYEFFDDLVAVETYNESEPNLSKDSFVISKKTFEKHKKHLRNVPFKHRFYCISDDYFKAYKAGYYFNFRDYDKMMEGDPFKFLKGKYDREQIARDETNQDGWFYGLDGKPILSYIFFDSIRTPFRTSRSKFTNFEKLEKWLKKNKNIKDVTVEPVPYYFEENGMMITFAYLPTELEWKWVSKQYRSEFSTMNRLERIIVKGYKE